MAKEKVTLTLESRSLEALRALVGRRSLSSAVDQAVAAYVARARHLAAVDEWLAELEAEHGPPPAETIEWAARLVDDWSKKKRRRRKAG
jgi:predicted transcriptional regulator